ncbi:MAG TPA: GNAT family N-acetyltransferase [Xanthobacteraceae bacterium]|nr:GNAT family N-acetyltransferase [Xanthobacteraceae bacterium]
MTAPDITLRRYADSDEEPCIELWRRTWTVAYPQIDFDARVVWWRERWRNELVPAATIVVAEHGGDLAGFVTVDARTGYLDQIVVAPEAWRTNIAAMLMDEAKRISPRGINLLVNADNARAIAFYAKQGFIKTGTDVNPTSGAPVDKMSWRPAS